jgi:hypothetical protein
LPRAIAHFDASRPSTSAKTVLPDLAIMPFPTGVERREAVSNGWGGTPYSIGTGLMAGNIDVRVLRGEAMSWRIRRRTRLEGIAGSMRQERPR